MTRTMPELVLAVVVDEQTHVAPAVRAELHGRGPAWRVVQIDLFAKCHHLDEHGTVDTFPVGRLDARLLELGAVDDVRRQVRAALSAAREEIGGALAAQGFDAPPARVPELAVEIDLHGELARQLRHPQPPVSDVTPPITVIGTGTGTGTGGSGAGR